jgi:ComF family protein
MRTAEKVFCGLFNLLFPDDCRVCGEPLQQVSRIPVCNRCLKEPAPMEAEHFCVACRTPFLNRFPLDETGRCALCRLGLSGFDAVYSYGSYEGSLRKLVHLFKYGKVTPLVKPLGQFLSIALPREQSFDAIVPMPLHWWRRWRRGFNQADLLAREIARRWNLPVSSIVKRVRATSPQAGLTHAKRRSNVSGAFAVKRSSSSKKPLLGMRVLLVDDVLTTGASAAACARALKRAGAKHVTVLALARADRRTSLPDLKNLNDAGNFSAAIGASAAAAAGSVHP